MTAQRFAIATRDELWIGGRMAERRLSHGEALERDGEILASDVRDDSLVAACDAAVESMRQLVVPDARIRLVAESTPEGTVETITVRMDGRSIVTSPAFFAVDLAFLRSVVSKPVEAPPLLWPLGDVLPFLWKHGSASVLVHEAVGHPAEYEPGDEPHAVAWPEWLVVDVPTAMRRATFKDVPLRRMTSVLARQVAAPFVLPGRRVEVLLVDGGGYDPLTGMVSLRIGAADLVEGDQSRRLPPFQIVASRDEVARSLTGGTGEPLRYPGVVCSREGQELVVASYAPLLLTEHR